MRTLNVEKVRRRIKRALSEGTNQPRVRISELKYRVGPGEIYVPFKVDRLGRVSIGKHH